MHGYRPEEIVGLPLRELVHPSRHRRVSDLGREVESRGGFEAESVHVRKDATSFPVEVRGTLLSYRGQLHTLVSVLDITERVRAQQALLRAEKLRALAQMAGSIAHEFNNILVSIRGYADLALIGVPQDLAKVREDLQWIQSGVKDAAHAVRRLQHLYRRADDLSDLVPVQLDDLASEALAMTQPLWQDRLTAQGGNLAVNTRFAAPPLVLGNPDELRRILARVIANAIDAMPTGGTLTVASGCDAAWSFVTVSDTGAGVVSDLPEKVFEPFFTTETDADDGLGMTMSMNILERHGGELSVDSKPGEGTTFTLRLPAMSGPTSDDNR
jgi:signal transduction histidine kinase